MTLSRIITVAAILAALFGMCCGLPQWVLYTLLVIGLHRTFTISLEVYRRWSGVDDTMFTRASVGLFKGGPVEQVGIKAYAVMLLAVSLATMWPAIYAAMVLGLNLLAGFFVLVAACATIYITSVAIEVNKKEEV